MSKESEIEEIKEDLGAAKDLSTQALTPGGKALIKALSTDIISSIETLTTNRGTLTLQEFIAIACDIKARLDVARAMSKAKKNKQLLEEILKEALQK